MTYTIDDKTDAPPKSGVLYARLATKPPTIQRGKGIYLNTDDGRKILDASCGAAVACLGHDNSRVKEAIIRQLDDVAYCYAPFFTTAPAEELAQHLCASTGWQMSRVFIVSSGTEAVEAAVKLARQYFLEGPTPQPQRTKFIARDKSYHGNTLGALSVGGHQARKAPYLPILSTNVSHVSPCYSYRDQSANESDESYVGRLAQELEEEFQRQGPDQVCAFIAETVAGTTIGSVPAVKGYFAAMKAVCERHNALLIMDEVMSGMGRAGTLHAWEQEGVVPDLQTVAKGLGAGYAPIGALLVNDKIVKQLEQGTGGFQHSQTYQGHPVACAAALEVQKIVQEENLLANVKEMGLYLETSLKRRLEHHKHVGDVRGRGLFWGIEFVKDKATKTPFPADHKVAPSVHAVALQDHSLSLIPSTGMANGRDGDIVQLAPPYNVTRQEVDMIVERTAAAIEQVLGSSLDS